MKKTIFLYILFTGWYSFGQDINQNINWIQNSFPSAHHKNNNYISYGGEMRGQRVNYFGVSPSNPNFMLMSGNMAGQGLVATNGKDFKPFGTKGGWCGNTFGFSPHNSTMAFALMGTKIYGGKDDANWGTEHPFGIYRTLDTGNTWTQVLRLPENIVGNPNSINTTPGQEPIGKCSILVDPSPTRNTHVYYGSGENGLVRSKQNGDKDTWETIAFEGKFIKTMSAGVSSGDKTRLYLVVCDENNSIKKIKDGQDYFASGQLYMIEFDGNGSFNTPKLCLNGMTNITDVETDVIGRKGYVIVDDSVAGLESTGGRALYPFGVKGDPLPNLGSRELGTNIDGATLTQSDDGIILDAATIDGLSELGAIYRNPYNENHWVIQAGGALNNSLIWSSDNGVSWNGYNRTLTTAPSGQTYVPDFTSYAVGQYHMEAYNWKMDYESGRATQGSAVGFMDSSTVVWMSSSKDRPALKSTDYGATATTFTTGTETKWLNQINTNANDQLIGCSFGEYGFTLSTDGGQSWQGFSEFSSDFMEEIETLARDDFGSGGASNRAAFAIVFEEGIPLNQPQHAIILGSRSGIIIDAWQNAAQTDWILSLRGSHDNPQRIYENHKDDAKLIGEAFWVDNYVYLGNYRSKDNGQTFERIYTAPGGNKLVVLEVSSSNGKIAIATTNRNGVDTWGLNMYLTTDGGDSWTALEKPIRETAYAADGTATKLFPICFEMYNRNRHSIGIDPRPEKDPTLGGDIRFLVPGRSGIYEYDDARTEGKKWKILNDGLGESLHYNKNAFTPWMGTVHFDPRQNGRVYALQTSDKATMSKWKTPDINANCTYEGEGTFKPVYMSADWGATWINLDNESLPDYLTLSTMHVSKTGNVYLASVNAGIFKLDDESQLPTALNVPTYHSDSKNIVYPNPSEGSFNFGKNIQKISVYNFTGNIVFQAKETDSIDLSFAPSGIYFIKFTDDLGITSTQKIVKK